MAHGDPDGHTLETPRACSHFVPNALGLRGWPGLGLCALSLTVIPCPQSTGVRERPSPMLSYCLPSLQALDGKAAPPICSPASALPMWLLGDKGGGQPHSPVTPPSLLSPSVYCALSCETRPATPILPCSSSAV